MLLALNVFGAALCVGPVLVEGVVCVGVAALCECRSGAVTAV